MAAQTQQSSLQKHKSQVQTGLQKSGATNTPLERSRQKKFSAYEASDDESVLEFQNIENQLLRDKGTKAQGDGQIPNQQASSKFKKASTQRLEAQLSPKKQLSNNLPKKKPSTIVKQDLQPITAPTTSKEQNAGEQKKETSKSSGKCYSIFCCGYCCSKGTGVSDKEKNQELNLARPEKMQNDVTFIGNNKGQKSNAGYNHDQDLSLIDDREEMDYNSVSQSVIDLKQDQIDDEKNKIDSNQDNDDSIQDNDSVGDEEKVELDLRSDLKPNSGEHSINGFQRSIKSSSDPLEVKNVPNIDIDDQLAVEDDHVSNASFNRRQQEIMQNQNIYTVENNTRTSPDGRFYTNDHFMRIDGQTPESQIQMISDEMSPKIERSLLSDNYHNDHSQQVESENMEGNHHHNRQDNQADEIDGDDSLQDMDDVSDRTTENDQEQYKLAQAKRMYIIHEVDEDQLSEMSSRKDKSQRLSYVNQRQHSNAIDHSMQGDQNILQILKEENEDEDVYGLNQIRHHQTLSLDNDMSNMQINGSQDIEPHNNSAGINFQLTKQASIENSNNKNHIRIENDQTNEKQGMQKSKTWNKQEIPVFIDENGLTHSPNFNSKSLINFGQYMQEEEAKQVSPIRAKQRSQNSPSQKNIKVEDGKQQTAFFRPQRQSNGSIKGSAIQPNNSPTKSKQDQEEILFINDIDAQFNLQVSPFEQKQYSQNNNNSYIQQQQLPQQSPQTQVIIQKVSVDKSKLMQSPAYQNFDQFLIANNLNQEDQTMIASNQKYIDEGKEKAKILNESQDQILLSKENKSKTQDRISLIEKQKTQQAAHAKQRAVIREKERSAKVNCAIRIQKIWKGYQIRKDFAFLVKNLRKVKALRKLFENHYLGFKQGLLNDLKSHLQKGKQNIDKEEKEMMNNFLNVCAVQIQSAWRGSKYRMKELPSIKNQRKAEERIRAFVRAWKVRKVMQTREVFLIQQHIKDLTKVQQYFYYLEKENNPLLLQQLHKDRRSAIQTHLDAIDGLYKSGAWIKSYIGNKIIENDSLMDSTQDGESHLKSPIKEYRLDTDTATPLKELVTTERFLYDEDLERNPYIFESDEFVRQKFLERRQKEYSGVEIRHETDDFIGQQQHKGQNYSGANLSKKAASNKSRNNLKAVDDDSSSLMSDEKLIDRRTIGNQQSRSYAANPKDNLALPKHKLTFDQMLENAIQHDKSGSKGGRGVSKSGSQSFLKRKERYDPKMSIINQKGVVSEKNINKRRVFKSNERDEDSEISNDDGDGIYSDGAQSESKGTFKNFPRKSFIQIESEPLISNKTILPPTLLQKLYSQQVKTQMFLRTDTGRFIGSNHQSYQPLNKNQVYPKMANGSELDQGKVILALEELDKIYSVYHEGKDANMFLKASTIIRDKNSAIPVLKEKAMFFNFNDDSVYESVLEELRNSHIRITKDNKKWMLGSAHIL
ncbi:UNKNOWN [Stylonychia lemnae]|uniref:Iq calmodulin-binding motif family protein n=1 Tax=Stylonychia lemnae TaxID=5949 RepID=A0A078B5D5_STYLE|nr:UNKNOWN [Stylonychia lemnae]|eukprot:CDW88748.1 UNKNOWN [Stylonychia lemnae]